MYCNLLSLNNLILNMGLEQGDITLTNSRIMWKNDLELSMTEGILSYDNDEIYLIGRVLVNANNIDNFYKSFQVKKVKRKKINELEFDFIYNLNQNKFQFDNIKIDKKSNQNIDKFIDGYNSKGKIFTNKVTFKNFINDFFDIYSG